MALRKKEKRMYKRGLSSKFYFLEKPLLFRKTLKKVDILITKFDQFERIEIENKKSVCNKIKIYYSILRSSESRCFILCLFLVLDTDDGELIFRIAHSQGSIKTFYPNYINKKELTMAVTHLNEATFLSRDAFKKVITFCNESIINFNNQLKNRKKLIKEF